MSYYTTGSGSIMLRIPSDTARRQLYDDLLGNMTGSAARK